jgi:hypothetical protein
MGGLVISAMGGAGEGLMRAGHQVGEYATRSALQAEMAELTKARDERLNEFATASQGREFQFRTGERVAGQEFQAGESEKGRTFQSSESEKGRVFQGDQNDKSRKIQSDQLAETARHNKANESILAAAEGRLSKAANLDASIKEIVLGNAKRVEDLRKEFSGATPERQSKIREEIHLLSGKDANTKYLPLPMKDDMGNLVGYRIFDTERREFVEDKGAAAKAGAGKPGDRPAFESFFGGGKPKAAPASAAPSGSSLVSGAMESTDSVTKYGPLTPDAILQRDAKAGVPAAVEYLKKRTEERDQAAVDLENQRRGITPGMMP